MRSSMLRFSVAVLIAMAMIAPAMAAENVAEKLIYEDREDIPIQYRWNLDDIMPSLQAWDAAAVALEEKLPEMSRFVGTLGSSPETLADALDLRYELDRAVEDLYVYASQWQNTDTRDADANSYQSRAQALRGRYLEAIAFLKPEINQLDAAKLAEYRKDERLHTYDHLFDNIVRTSAHVLSKDEEELLAGAALLTGAPSAVYSSLINADIKWPTIAGEDGEVAKVIPAQYYTFMGSQDRRVRRDAALALFGTYDEYGNSLAKVFAASVHKDVWLARGRNYGSTLEMALDKINVPPVVLENLVGTVHENFDIIHRYVALRRKVLEIEDFHIYDLYVSMVPSVDRKVSFDEGWAMAMEFWTEILGEDYAAVAARAKDERWVDVYSSSGKRGGAYSWGTYNSHPYLFLNWGGTLEDVFTLVHEMGHSIHTYMANSSQPSHDADYSLFVAEVASVASESLFFEWLLARTEDPTERLALLNHRINSITGTFLRQVFFHDFEASSHAMAERGEPLTKESLGEVWQDTWKRYYGPDAVVDEVFKAGWARIPHFYRTFYVWNYATSFAAGEAIAGRFRAGDASAVHDYLATLKLGGSVYPMQALERAGVDLEDQQVTRTVMERYRSILEEMEQLLLD